MKITVLGKGFLGSEFERQGYDVRGRDKFDVLLFRDNDFTFQWDRLKEYDVIVNCIGQSDTRWCENNFKEARWINGEFPSILSRFCKNNDIKLVHISTGCLYDNSNVPCKEDDFIVAHCKYTVSKWIGEDGCDLERDLILRPRLFFGGVRNKKNLLCKLPLFKKYINVLNSYTNIQEIPKAMQALLDNEQTGIFNVSNRGYRTVYELAQLLDLGGERMNLEELHKSQNIYLVNNVMDTSKLEQFYKTQHIEEAIATCWNELKII